MAHSVRTLRAALADLAELVPVDDRWLVADLDRRLAAGALRVLAVGEAKRGKSTLLNALCDVELLPTGVVPLTAVETTLRYGPIIRLTAAFRDGSHRELAVDALAGLVTEDGNPGNRAGVVEVALELPSPLLARGVELVDTPGVGSVHAHNTHAAMSALGRMDAAIFVVTADPPISASERAFLRRIGARAVRVFCVLNKADRLREAELAEAVEFTRAVVERELGRAAPLFPLSARAAGAGPDPGFAAFRDAFTRYLDESAGADLGRAVRRHAARLAGSVAETQQAVLAAWGASAADLAERLRLFRQTLDAVEAQRADALAAAAGEFQRLRQATDEQAAALVAAGTQRLVRDVRAYLEGLVGDAGTLEERALCYAADAIRGTVEQWRERRAQELDEAVRALDQRLSERLTEQVRRVRDVATRLFAFPLPAWPQPEGLTVGSSVTYAFAPDPGQVDAVASALRHRLPGRLGRRQVERYVTGAAAALLDRHLGRARAAFQEGLEATSRALRAELDRRFTEGAGRIAAALTTVADRRTQQQRLQEAERAAVERVLQRALQLSAEFQGTSDDAEPEVHADRGPART